MPAAKQTAFIARAGLLNALVASQIETPLEQAARPLLRLAQHITGFETTFLTSINWQKHRQRVLYSLNKGGLDLVEGITVDWHDEMCRSRLLSRIGQSSELGVDVPATANASEWGIKSFCAAPIVVADKAIATVCVASQTRSELDGRQREGMRLIADSLQQMFEVERERSLAQGRAESAERDAAQARSEAMRHATDTQQMQRLAHTDVLTGLPNRRGFMARWEAELSRSRRHHTPIGLMLIDADHFKKVNDTMGHAMGDAVLRAIGATLLQVRRHSDVAARLGGDEFAIFTTSTDSGHMAALADEIRLRFAVIAAELDVETTLSFGMVSSENCPRHNMLADADEALYRSKAAGGDTAAVHLCPEQ